MTGDARIKYYTRAAEQRLLSAQVLLNHERYLDAIYLAGYAVECSLKAVILSAVPEPRRETYEGEHFRGRAGHNLESLYDKLIKMGQRPPDRTMRRIVGVVIRDERWTTDLRYESYRARSDEANRFCDDAAEIVRWMKGRA